MISALIRSRSVNLQKVAESMEGSAKIESNYRRIQRLFKEQVIDYGVTAQLLLSESYQMMRNGYLQWIEPIGDWGNPM